MAAVAVRGVTKSFGSAAALDRVTLEAADGESIAVLGPSGCGKTTLLRIIAGLETPDSGQVLFDGQDVTQASPRERHVGLVFQNYALYPHMDSKRNLGFFFKMHRRAPEIDARVAAVAEIMGAGFAELLARKPKALSGGQQQRVAIGRCIIRDPRVFLFDEPLSNLDAKVRQQTRVELKRLLRRFSITSFYVTHDQSEATAIGDRLAVMRRGRLEQVAPYREVYDRPANAFVAGFVGTPPMNLLPGLAGEGGGLLVDAGREVPADAGTLEPPAARPGRADQAGQPRARDPAGSGRPGGRPLPAAGVAVAGLAPGEPVLLGLRAESFRLANEGAAGLDVRVVVSEPLVAERKQLVTCRLDSGAAAGPQLVARLGAEERFAPGRALRLTFDARQLHLFGADGRRLEAMVYSARQ